MKKIFPVLLCVILLMLGCAHAEWLPLYEAYPVSPDGNLWIEVPNAYDVMDASVDYPCLYIVSPQMQMCLVVKIPEGYRHRWTSRSADISGFQEDGAKVLAGADKTEASTVIERCTIDDLPAARVDMTGQGYEMIWVGDGGDMYFFMYPLEDAEFAADMVKVAATMHLITSNAAPTTNEADYAFTADETGVTITGYTGSAVRVAIPECIGGKPVVALADDAFAGSDVTWLSVPDSVQSIGTYCFSGCTRLQTLHLPSGLTVLPMGMLESCFRLQALDIPDSVTTIEKSVFWGNFYLEELRLPASLQTLEGFNFLSAEYLTRFIVPEGCAAVQALDDGAVLLSGDGRRLIHYCGGQTRTSYTIPEGVERIDSFAFSDWGMLEEIVVPEGVTAIEGAAFLHAWGLKRLILPASAVELGRMDAVVAASDDGELTIAAPQEDSLSAVNLGQAAEGVTAIAGSATIVAPEGSAAQAHALQFNLTFEAAPAADEVLQE